MKNLKEIYREFKTNLLVYMSPETPTQTDMPTIKYEGMETLGVTVEKDVEKATLDGTRFAQKREKAQELINKINLDANPELKTQAEKDLEKRLTDHNTNQFRLLEHNYNLAKNHLGENWKKEQSPMKEAEVILEKSTDNFIRKLEMHIFKENVANGNEESCGQIIEQILHSKGIDLRGIGKFIVKGMGESFFRSEFKNLKTKEDIVKKLEELLSGEEGKKRLAEAIKQMEASLPKIEYTVEKSDYFHTLFEKTKKDGDNRLTKVFGEKKENKDYAAGVLAKRFHIEWTKKEGKTDFSKPEYLVDVTTNKVYKPDTEEFMDKLRSICHNELGDPEDMTKHDKALGKIEGERKAKFKELKEGKRGIASWFDKQVKTLDDLRKNPLLAEVLQMTTEYQRQTNGDIEAASGRLQRLSQDSADSSVGRALDRLTATLTPEKARAAGIVGDLVELIKMIEELFGKKDAAAGLQRIEADIAAGRNPVEKQRQETENRNKAIEQYKKLLDKGKPTLNELVNIFTDSKAAEKYFRDKGMQNADKYTEERTGIIKTYFENQLGVSDLKITKTSDGGYLFDFKSGTEKKSFYVKEVAGNKLEIAAFLTPSKKITIDNNLAALAGAFKPVVAQPEAAPQAPAKKEYKGKKFVDNNGVLKDIGPKIKIQDVLSTKDFEGATIKIDKPRQDFQKGAEVAVKQSGDTFVINMPGRKPVRLHVFDGDKITEVTPKPTVVAKVEKGKKASK